jgi:membrane peptidoglycan carboxypeptidase
MGLVSGTSCGNSCGLSAAIGDGSDIRLDEHTNGYATLARGGVYKPVTYILQIQDRNGKVLQQWKNTAGTQVLDPQIAYILDNILSDPKASYFGDDFRLNNGYESAMKTGTTNNLDNGLMMGYTPNIAVGMWMGRMTDNGAMYNYTDTILGPAWHTFMTEANKLLNIKPQKWVEPAGIKTVCINQITGFATTYGGTCDIFPSWYQPRYPTSAKSAVIDTVSGLLATACTPADARQTITGGGINSELASSDPLYENFIKPEEARYGRAGGNIPTTYDDIHTCVSSDEPTVQLSSPTESSTTPGEYTVTATYEQGKAPLKTLNFRIDGTIASGGSFDISNQTCTQAATCTQQYTYTVTAGSHELTAEVIDNVLYDVTSAQVPVDYTPITLNTPSTVKHQVAIANNLINQNSYTANLPIVYRTTRQKNILTRG